MPTLLQFDFPMSGPWGEEMAAAFGDLAGIIGRSPGSAGRSGPRTRTRGRVGASTCSRTTSRRSSTWKSTARLEGFGITDIRAKLFHVNESLTALNGGPV